MKTIVKAAMAAFALLLPLQAGATRFMEIKVVDKDYLMLRFRDGEAYSQGVTNPSVEWTIMFQAGCTTMAAAFLYNVTGDREWEDAMAEDSMIKGPDSHLFEKGWQGAYYQIWSAAAYLACPHERHYPELYANLKASVAAHAQSNNVDFAAQRPSRRNDGGWPRQESFFNQRYLWVNGEFTPRETMRGKMALLAYLYGIR